MSRFLNEEEFSTARQKLLDAGYSENGADVALKEHQEKYKPVEKSIEQNLNNSSMIRLGMEGAAAGLGVYGGVKLGKGIYDRMFNAPNPNTSAMSSGPQEPTLDVNKPLAGKVGDEPVWNEPTPKSAPINAVGTPEKIAPQSYPPGMTAQTEIGNRPKDMGLVEQSEYNALSKRVTAAEKKAAPEGSAPAPESKVKKPAVPTFKTPSDIPEGMIFRSDVGNLDRGLVNILGPEGRLYAKEVLNEGKMFGNAGADYNQKIKEIVGKYGEELKKITPSIDLTTREGRIAVGAPHTENYGSALGKAAKVGGVLGTLMTVAQSANAREAAGNVAESLLPIGMTPSELQSGKLTAKQLKAFEEAQKLGSPYRSVPPPR